MAEFTLKAEPFLGGYKESFDGATLVEVSNLALVSIAVPLGGGGTLGRAMKAAFGADLPDTGGTSRSKDGKITFLGLGADQIFAAFSTKSAGAVDEMSGKLGNAGYYCGQSDNWVMLRLSGVNAVPALERIVPLDLDRGQFPAGAVKRTVAEHLGVILLREAGDRFLLMSASSSARSFLHAVETSIRNVT